MFKLILLKILSLSFLLLVVFSFSCKTETHNQLVLPSIMFELPLRSNSGQSKLLNYFKPGVIDLSGLYYSPLDRHLLVISDAYNIIVEYSSEFELLKEFAFPGDYQEGIAVDDYSYMYVAQDCGGIVKLKWLRNE